MAYVNSVNGQENVRIMSPVVANGVKVPRVVYIDAAHINTTGGKSVLQALRDIAPMQPIRIEETDDYVLDMGNGGFY